MSRKSTGKNVETPFSKYLKQQHVRLINEHGPNFNQLDMANWIGIEQPTFNNHYNGRRTPRPGDPIIEKYAEKLGLEVYDVLGLRRPLDPSLNEFIKVYDNVPPEMREQLLREFLDKISRVISEK
jgi:hypothetical protein